jgi:hypothetical protein
MGPNMRCKQLKRLLNINLVHLQSHLGRHASMPNILVQGAGLGHCTGSQHGPQMVLNRLGAILHMSPFAP